MRLKSAECRDPSVGGALTACGGCSTTPGGMGGQSVWEKRCRCRVSEGEASQKHGESGACTVLLNFSFSGLGNMGKTGNYGLVAEGAQECHNEVRRRASRLCRTPQFTIALVPSIHVWPTVRDDAASFPHPVQTYADPQGAMRRTQNTGFLKNRALLC